MVVDLNFLKVIKFLLSIFFFSLIYSNSFSADFSFKKIAELEDPWGSSFINNDEIIVTEKGGKIIVNISITSNKKIIVKIIDEGQGFKEKDTSKIFRRFYSNRPDKFGEHSGLGLNIVKNLVELHDGKIVASNRPNNKGAIMEISFLSI